MDDFVAFHRRTHLVRHHECGPDGRMKLQVLLDCLQDIAAEHAEKLKCGMEDLAGANRIWVLSRLKIRILRMPGLKEEVELLTYPTGHDRLFAHRQYCVSAGGADLVQASSAWLMLDGATYRPLPMARVFDAPLPTNPERPRYFENFDKLPEAGGPELCAFTVGASGIDLNRHLNNAFYAGFIEDALSLLEPGADFRIAELQINFQHAGLPGDRIGIAGKLDGKDFLISGGKFFCAGGFLREKQ